MAIIMGGKNTSKNKNIIGDNIKGQKSGAVTLISSGGTTVTVNEVAIIACVADSNITLDNTTTTIDGYTLQDADYILAQNQTTATENGLYEYNTNGNMVRITDNISIVNVKNGAVYAEKMFGLFSTTGAQNWEQIGGGGSATVDNTINVNEIRRYNVSSFATAQADGYLLLLVNQNTTSQNGLYIADSGTFVPLANNYIYFLCTIPSAYVFREIWVKIGAYTFESATAQPQLMYYKARNNFTSCINATAPERNLGEFGAFKNDGAYREAPLMVVASENVFLFENIADILRINTNYTADMATYEVMQLKCTYRLALTNVFMDTGFNIIVSQSAGAPVPTIGLLQINKANWDTIVGDNYYNIEDYSVPIAISNPGAGFKDIVVQGEFFIDMIVDAQFNDFRFILDNADPAYPFEVRGYINWQIANMKSA